MFLIMGLVLGFCEYILVIMFSKVVFLVVDCVFLVVRSLMVVLMVLILVEIIFLNFF